MSDSWPQKAWGKLIADPLTGRHEKPRTSGLSMIIDTGMGIRETSDLAELAAPYIDLVKFGFGSSVLYPKSLLQNKIAVLREHEIDVYPGGTLLETAVVQKRWKEFMHMAKKLGFTLIEVSDGTIQLDQQLRKVLIQYARNLGFKVLSEVGKKESGTHLPIEQQLEQIECDLEAGASNVIIEGRESGKSVGIFEEDGAIRADDLQFLSKHLRQIDCVIWEAPLKSQQEQLIRHFGVNVNLGNLPPHDILSVESLRRGLRSDTLRIVLENEAEKNVI